MLSGEGRLVAGTAVGLAVVCVCGALIATLVDDVSERDGVTVVDRRLLDWVLEHRTSAWTTVFRTVTHLGDPLVIVALTAVVSIALIVCRKFHLGVLMILATSGAAVASSVTKQALDRVRPPTALWLGQAWGPSFPSGHATQSVACYGAIAVIGFVLVRSTAWRALLFVSAAAIALMVGTSRIYLAVHWFSDVVCGWAIGSLWLATLVLAGWATPRLRTVWLGRPIRPDRESSPPSAALPNSDLESGSSPRNEIGIRGRGGCRGRGRPDSTTWTCRSGRVRSRPGASWSR